MNLPPIRSSFVICLALSGCATQIQMQVPQVDGKEFAKCLEDPTTSYRRVPSDGATSNSLVLGVDLRESAKVDAGSDRLFVTDDQLPASARSSADDTGWAAFVAAAWHTTSAEVIQNAGVVDELWAHPVHQAFLQSFNALAKPAAGSVKDPPTIKADDVLAYWKLTRAVASTDAWYAFAARSAARLSTLLAADRSTLSETSAATRALEVRLLTQKMKAGIYISTYLKAYFRNGKFVTLNWDIGNPIGDLEKLAGAAGAAGSDKSAIDHILQELNRIDPNAKAEIDKMLTNSFSGHIGKIATAGLITRGGDSLAMPAITLTADFSQTKLLTGTKVDVNAVMEDVVRVTFEALYDSLNLVPAVSNATAVAGLPKEDQGAALPDFTKVVSAYRETAPGVPGVTMDAESFGNIDADGAKIETFTASAVASLIRGANIAALNNEALANSLTMIAATTARKVTERVTWCFYAVIGPQPEGTLAAGNSTPRSSKTITLTLKH